jgi:NAD(P)H dehydrogenase (quinone)
MILVTGAGGKTGKAVIKALVARGVPVRAFVRSSAHEPAVKAMGISEVVAGAMDDADAVCRAVRGTDAVYHICPNVNPNEVVFAKTLIAAATNSGVSRLVYHSVLHPQIEATGTSCGSRRCCLAPLSTSRFCSQPPICRTASPNGIA